MDDSTIWVFVPTILDQPFLPFVKTSCIGDLLSAVWQFMNHEAGFETPGDLLLSNFTQLSGQRSEI
ncbi:hypothetical protein EI94DRAFT_1757508, partial [Lactarius quietus]